VQTLHPWASIPLAKSPNLTPPGMAVLLLLEKSLLEQLELVCFYFKDCRLVGSEKYAREDIPLRTNDGCLTYLDSKRNIKKYAVIESGRYYPAFLAKPGNPG
jgi:hypothetical protein